MELDLFRYLCFYHKTCITMNKGTHFIGQPMYGQLINLLDKSKILRFSRENGGERYGAPSSDVPVFPSEVPTWHAPLR